MAIWFRKWYPSMIVLHLDRFLSRTSGRRCARESNTVIGCEHKQVLLTILPQEHCRWQPQGDHKGCQVAWEYRPHYVASLDIRTACPRTSDLCYTASFHNSNAKKTLPQDAAENSQSSAIFCTAKHTLSSSVKIATPVQKLKRSCTDSRYCGNKNAYFHKGKDISLDV